MALTEDRNLAAFHDDHSEKQIRLHTPIHRLTMAKLSESEKILPLHLHILLAHLDLALLLEVVVHIRPREAHHIHPQEVHHKVVLHIRPRSSMKSDN